MVKKKKAFVKSWQWKLSSNLIQSKEIFSKVLPLELLGDAKTNENEAGWWRWNLIAGIAP